MRFSFFFAALVMVQGVCGAGIAAENVSSSHASTQSAAQKPSRPAAPAEESKRKPGENYDVSWQPVYDEITAYFRGFDFAFQTTPPKTLTAIEKIAEYRKSLENIKKPSRVDRDLKTFMDHAAEWIHSNMRSLKSPRAFKVRKQIRNWTLMLAYFLLEKNQRTKLDDELFTALNEASKETAKVDITLEQLRDEQFEEKSFLTLLHSLRTSQAQVQAKR